MAADFGTMGGQGRVTAVKSLGGNLEPQPKPKAIWSGSARSESDRPLLDLKQTSGNSLRHLDFLPKNIE